MQIEAVVESLISQGVISREEVEAKIAEYRKSSPVNDLNNIAMVEAIQMELIDHLGQMVGTLMMKVAELEGRLNA